MPISPSQLTSEHLEDMLAHETEYPPEYRLGRSRLQQKLLDLEQSGCSMSWILHDQGKCVAYIVVYPQFSRLEQERVERVIYVDDVFVKKGHEVCLFRLIQLFTRQAIELGLRDLPIEGVCRVGAYKAFATHDPLLQKLGWELAKKSEYWDNTVNEEMCWLRWEPLYDVIPPASKDKVSVGGEEDDGFYSDAPKLITLEDSARYAYRPTVLPDEYYEEDEDEFSALTEAMIGKGDDDLVEIRVEPPVDRAALLDVFGIQQFFGHIKPRGRERILERRETKRDLKQRPHPFF